VFLFPDGGPVLTKDFVFDSLLLPTTPALTQQHSADLDGDGKPDNALAKIMDTVGSFGFDSQKSVTRSVNTGELLFLFRLRAQDFASAPVALGKTWLGKQQVCCTTPKDPVQCAADAKQKCFTGTQTFELHPTAPNPSTATGSITAGKISLGPAMLKIAISLTSTPIVVTLKKGFIHGQLKTGPDQIVDGTIVGAIPQQDVDNVIIPALAAELDALLKDPAGDAAAKLLLGLLFDTNHDGTVTAAELAQVSMIKNLFAPDVDVDGDGVKELSLGVGFTAVGATIVAP
jgi:hypothetical protein